MRRAIARKRDGGALEADVWREIVAGYLAQRVDDAQLAALLMACVVRGLEEPEIEALTAAFVASGTQLAPGAERVVDKHSTGGVGDTATLIVVPLVAACGVPVAKLSGRALGHTGGTLDKLEAVRGVRTDLPLARFSAHVREIGCAVAAHGEQLVPADKRIYALRDRTATVPSLGLIAASVVSKKIAGGAHAIVYDVKAGRGAFAASVSEAQRLAQLLVRLSASFGKDAVALVTDMEEPLGPAVGTGLEMREARDFLRGDRRDARLLEVCLRLGEAMLRLGGRAEDPRAALRAALDDGRAFERLERMLALQGAERGALASLSPHPERIEVRADRAGYVATIDAVALGELARSLVERAGPCAGILLNVRVGERVEAGAALASAHGEGEWESELKEVFALSDDPPPVRPLIYGEIGSRAKAADAGEAAWPRSMLEIK